MTPANAWIAEFRVQDDIADVDVPAIFTANIRYDGPGPRKDVEVALTIDNVRSPPRPSISSLTVAAGAVPCITSTSPLNRGNRSLSRRRSPLPLTSCRADDARHLTVPVVAALPVMFVDQYGCRG
jgi:hypothetical protein